MGNNLDNSYFNKLNDTLLQDGWLQNLYSADRTTQKAELKKLFVAVADNNITKAEKEALEAKAEDLADQLETLEAKMAVLSEKMEEKEEQIQKAVDEISSLVGSVDAKSAKMQEEQTAWAKQCVKDVLAMYEKGDIGKDAVGGEIRKRITNSPAVSKLGSDIEVILSELDNQKFKVNALVDEATKWVDQKKILSAQYGATKTAYDSLKLNIAQVGATNSSFIKINSVIETPTIPEVQTPQTGVAGGSNIDDSTTNNDTPIETPSANPTVPSGSTGSTGATGSQNDNKVDNSTDAKDETSTNGSSNSGGLNIFGGLGNGSSGMGGIMDIFSSMMGGFGGSSGLSGLSGLMGMFGNMMGGSGMSSMFGGLMGGSGMSSMFGNMMGGSGMSSMFGGLMGGSGSSGLGSMMGGMSGLMGGSGMSSMFGNMMGGSGMSSMFGNMMGGSGSSGLSGLMGMFGGQMGSSGDTSNKDSATQSSTQGMASLMSMFNLGDMGDFDINSMLSMFGMGNMGEGMSSMASSFNIGSLGNIDFSSLMSMFGGSGEAGSMDFSSFFTGFGNSGDMSSMDFSSIFNLFGGMFGSSSGSSSIIPSIGTNNNTDSESSNGSTSNSGALSGMGSLFPSFGGSTGDSMIGGFGSLFPSFGGGMGNLFPSFGGCGNSGNDSTSKFPWWPSCKPSCKPDTPEVPTQCPTVAPTPTPTTAPGGCTSCCPEHCPTQAPTVAPTQCPTVAPTQCPTVVPTQCPTQCPTVAPSETPTVAPSETPTVAPSETPTVAPTQAPTECPTLPEVNHGDSIRKTGTLSFNIDDNENNKFSFVIDRNNDGVFTDSSELVGANSTSTWLDDLKTFDADNNGILEGEELDSVKLFNLNKTGSKDWSDGKYIGEEINVSYGFTNATDLGITSINLNDLDAEDPTYDEGGNLFMMAMNDKNVAVSRGGESDELIETLYGGAYGKNLNIGLSEATFDDIAANSYALTDDFEERYKTLFENIAILKNVDAIATETRMNYEEILSIIKRENNAIIKRAENKAQADVEDTGWNRVKGLVMKEAQNLGIETSETNMEQMKGIYYVNASLDAEGVAKAFQEQLKEEEKIKVAKIACSLTWEATIECARQGIEPDASEIMELIINGEAMSVEDVVEAMKERAPEEEIDAELVTQKQVLEAGREADIFDAFNRVFAQANLSDKTLEALEMFCRDQMGETNTMANDEPAEIAKVYLKKVKAQM